MLNFYPGPSKVYPEVRQFMQELKEQMAELQVDQSFLQRSINETEQRYDEMGESGMLVEEVKQKQPRVYRQWLEHPETVCPPEGETVVRDKLRDAPFLKERGIDPDEARFARRRFFASVLLDGININTSATDHYAIQSLVPVEIQADGTLLAIFGQAGPGDGEFNHPHGLALDRARNASVTASSSVPWPDGAGQSSPNGSVTRRRGCSRG